MSNTSLNNFFKFNCKNNFYIEKSNVFLIKYLLKKERYIE